MRTAHHPKTLNSELETLSEWTLGCHSWAEGEHILYVERRVNMDTWLASGGTEYIQCPHSTFSFYKQNSVFLLDLWLHR